MSNIPYDHDSGIFARKHINEIKKEIFRKSIHICAAFVPFFLEMNYAVTIVVLLSAALLYTAAEILRCRGFSVPVISRVTDMASRGRDSGRFVLGPVTLTLGIVASALFFNHTAASLGIYALAFGDGVASLMGKIFGRVRLPFTRGKTLTGSLSCFAAVFLSSFCVLHDVKNALAIAALAMILEVLPLRDYDNLLIPVAVAACAQYALGIV